MTNREANAGFAEASRWLDGTRPLHWPRRSRRELITALAIALVISSVSAAYQTWVYRTEPATRADFDPLYAGARVLLSGNDPYAAVGPAREFDWHWNLYYPAPALVVISPLTMLPLEIARTAFVAIGAALFAFGLALQRGNAARWCVFLSASWQTTVLLAHWSSYLAAAVLLPWVGVILLAKPNIGLAVMAGASRLRELRWPVIGGALLLLASFALQPDWLGRWLEAVQENRMRSSPVTRPWGFLLVLALLRWRRPEARLLLAMSIVPQTPAMYDMLLLFLVPVLAFEHVGLALLSQAAFAHSIRLGTAMEVDAGLIAFGNLLILYMFLPCLLMLLRRPNEGPAPAWLEARLARWPAWLRGRAIFSP